MIKPNLSLLLLLMNKNKNLIFFLLFILLVDCSFDDKTGIWTGSEDEKARIFQLEKRQNQNKNIVLSEEAGTWGEVVEDESTFKYDASHIRAKFSGKVGPGKINLFYDVATIIYDDYDDLDYDLN